MLDVQQVIPLPEATDYQIQIRAKQSEERRSRNQQRDFTKYDVTVGGNTYSRLPKRAAVFRVVQHLIACRHSPDEIAQALPWRKARLFRSCDGELTSEQFVELLIRQSKEGGRSFDPRRYYCNDAELFQYSGRTYALSNQWGTRTREALEIFSEAFPDAQVRWQES